MTAAKTQSPPAAPQAAPEALSPLERTFRALLNSKRPNAPLSVAFAVLNNSARAQSLAVDAALALPQRECLESLLRTFHQLPPEQQALAVARADLFLPLLRTAIHDSDVQVRANACDFLIRTDDTRIAYLLADLMHDTVDAIKTKAQEGILALAHNYHVLIANADREKTAVPRHVLETRRYALLDALLNALRFYKSHERPEIIVALLSLDPRGDEVLLDILANAMDRRRKVILDILDTACFPRAVSFLLTALKNARVASVAVEILEVRFDVEFLRAFLAAPDLFAQSRLIAAFGQIQFVPWLRPGSERVSQLHERLAVRAVRFLLLTGAKPEEKATILQRLCSSGNVALASAAKFVLAAQARHIHPDKIDAGLAKIEEHCPALPAEPPEPELAKLIVSKAEYQKPRGSAVLLSDEALFRNFLNSFDSLGKAERDSALGEFMTRGIFLRELKKALADPEVEIVLRAVKLLEHVPCQNDVTSELIFLTKHPDGRIRSAAVRQLGKSGARDALKTLFEALNDRDRRVLANAIEALEATGHKQILRLLEPLMGHPDNRVRANAAKAAWTLGSERGRQCLVEMLKNQKSNMRLSALWGLRQIGATDQMPLIRELAKSDPDERVRKSAQLTLAELENVL